MLNNKSISECFDALDTTKKETIDLLTLKSALEKFQLGLSSKELDTFISRIKRTDVR
jgi:hypothetical protein